MPLHSCTAAERISVLTNFHGLSKMRTSVSDEPVRSSARDWFNFFRKKVFGYNKLPKISSDEFSESNPEYSIREGNSDEGMNRFVLGAALIASISSTLLGYGTDIKMLIKYMCCWKFKGIVNRCWCDYWSTTVYRRRLSFDRFPKGFSRIVANISLIAKSNVLLFSGSLREFIKFDFAIWGPYIRQTL